MLYAQDDRVFMHSLATRGQRGGLAAQTRGWLGRLQRGGFEVIFVETVGIGQEATPFANGLVDRSVLVMNPGYGARLQLQKTAMLGVADIVVINKSDQVGAKAARAEIGERLATNQKLVVTCANRHRDAGVDLLFEVLREESAQPVSSP